MKRRPRVSYRRGPFALWLPARPLPTDIAALAERVRDELQSLTRGLRKTYPAAALLKVGCDYFTL